MAAYQLWSQKGPYFSPHSTAKINNKSTFLRKIGIYSEKTSLKKLLIIIIVVALSM